MTDLSRTFDEQPSIEDERRWIRQTQEGDHQAFNQLVRLHQAHLRAFAARSVLSSDDVYDITQDAFVSAFEHIDRFDNERDFGKWLRGICRNRMLKHFREQKKRSKGLCVISEALETKLMNVEIHREENAAARIEALRACIRELNDTDRQLIVDRYHNEKTIKEMAAELGKNAAAISVKLMRVRAALRKACKLRLRAS